jgi:hypothetical protein
MLRVLLGLLKGGVVGAAVGYGAQAAGLGTGVVGYLVYAAVGFVVGIVCGKPIWAQETLWTPVVKGIFGAGVCAGLYWGVTKLLGGVTFAPVAEVTGADANTPVPGLPLIVGPLLGALYGIFVEVDDGERKAKAAGASTTKPGAKPGGES